MAAENIKCILVKTTDMYFTEYSGVGIMVPRGHGDRVGLLQYLYS
jgi:hypothetical protein